MDYFLTKDPETWIQGSSYAGRWWVAGTQANIESKYPALQSQKLENQWRISIKKAIISRISIFLTFHMNFMWH